MITGNIDLSVGSILSLTACIAADSLQYGWVAAIIGIGLAEYWPAGGSLFAQRIIAILLLLCAAVLITGYDTRYPYSGWLLYLIGITCLLLAIPGLKRLWQGRTS